MGSSTYFLLGVIALVATKTAARRFRENPPAYCNSLGGCSCVIISEQQANCQCPEQPSCYVNKSPPRLTIKPSGPYFVNAGGGINVTCSAVAFPFPHLFWISANQDVPNVNENPFAYMSEQYLIIKSLYKTERFTCIASNGLGRVEQTIEILVKGPGTPPIITALKPDRTTIFMRWEPPLVVNSPLTRCAVHYSENKHLPIEQWKVEFIDPSVREFEIRGLRPATEYFIKVRAFDTLGAGILSHPIPIRTKPPASPPRVSIIEGDNIYIDAGSPLEITCNVSADPIATVTWLHGNKVMIKPERSTVSKLQMWGLRESTRFTCSALNEAGSDKRIIRVNVREQPSYHYPRSTATPPHLPVTQWFVKTTPPTFIYDRSYKKQTTQYPHYTRRIFATTTTTPTTTTTTTTTTTATIIPTTTTTYKWIPPSTRWTPYIPPATTTQRTTRPTTTTTTTTSTTTTITITTTTTTSTSTTTTTTTTKPTTRYIPPQTHAPKWSPYSNPSVRIHPISPTDGGYTILRILPGSRLTLACNASGSPEPSVQWDAKLDSEELKYKTVEHRGQNYLRAKNITTGAEFTCSAESSAGKSAWTIKVAVISNLPQNWKDDKISAEFDDASVVLNIEHELVRWLGIRDSWNLYFTDDADLKNDWEKIEGTGPMEGIRLEDTNQWTYYYIEIENPETGVLSPTFKVIASNWDASVEVQSQAVDDE